MSSLTPNLGLTVPTVGGDAGPLFAEEINGDLAIIDSIYGGQNSLNVGGAVNITLTETQAQNLIQQFTGVLTGNISVFSPAVGAFYAVENATTGPFTLSFGCASGGNVQLIPQGLSTWLWTDGTFTRLSNPPGWQELATYVASGASNLTIFLPGPFRRFRITLQYGQVSVSSELGMTVSNNGGASFATSGYITNAFGIVSSSIGYNASETAQIPFTAQSVANTNVAMDATIEFTTGNATAGFSCRGNGLVQAPNGLQQTFVMATGAVTGINAVSVKPTSGGTFSGTFIVEGLP